MIRNQFACFPTLKFMCPDGFRLIVRSRLCFGILFGSLTNPPVDPNVSYAVRYVLSRKEELEKLADAEDWNTFCWFSWPSFSRQNATFVLRIGCWPSETEEHPIEYLSIEFIDLLTFRNITRNSPQKWGPGSHVVSNFSHHNSACLITQYNNIYTILNRFSVFPICSAKK